MSYLLFRTTYKYQRALRRLAEEAPKILDLRELTDHILKVLLEDMRVERAAILINSDVKKPTFDVLAQRNFDDADLITFSEMAPEAVAAFEHNRRSCVCDELDYELQSEVSAHQKKQLETLKNLCTTSKSTVILGLHSQKMLMGFIVLGNKYSNKTYTKEDLDLLESISKELAMALVNSKLHQDKTILTRMLQEEVERATDRWKQKVKENEELFSIKSEFITVASHQMRTPISVIRNSIQMILEEYVPAEKNDTLESLRKRCDAMTMLLKNAFLASENLRNTTETILAASEFAGGGTTVNVNQIHTKKFLQERIDRLHDLVSAKFRKPVVFESHVAENLPEIMNQDEQKITRIVDHVLTNALLYTLEGSVKFTVSMENEYVVFTVEDTGIGIPESEQDKIFQKFIRFSNAKRVVPDGTGLGLYLVKQYCELLRGSITFISHENVGTTFTVRIPAQYTYIA